VSHTEVALNTPFSRAACGTSPVARDGLNSETVNPMQNIGYNSFIQRLCAVVLRLNIVRAKRLVCKTANSILQVESHEHG